tara:strand:+ start:1290 stop:1433 length:144 start_codon:yes stop_codon:yes gene_type:complete
MINKVKKYYHPEDEKFVEKEIYFDFLFGSEYLSDELKGNIETYKNNK